MIYDTAKLLHDLNIDWTAGAQGLEYICKHYPGKCPFYRGAHGWDEMMEWPTSDEMIEKLGDRFGAVHRTAFGYLATDFENKISVTGSSPQEVLAKLLIIVHNEKHD